MNEQRIERSIHKIYILNFRPLAETIVCFFVSTWEGVITEKKESRTDRGICYSIALEQDDRDRDHCSSYSV
jgi:hypothetical protein